MEHLVQTLIGNGILLAALAWFISRKFASYDRQHRDHYGHAGNDEKHWTAAERQMHFDTMRLLQEDLRRRSG